jgi:hypothetical protein
MLVAIPRSQPSTADARMIQTSEAWVEPMTKPSFTERVLAAIKRMRTISAARRRTAHV